MDTFPIQNIRFIGLLRAKLPIYIPWLHNRSSILTIWQMIKIFIGPVGQQICRLCIFKRNWSFHEWTMKYLLKLAISGNLIGTTQRKVLLRNDIRQQIFCSISTRFPDSRVNSIEQVPLLFSMGNKAFIPTRVSEILWYGTVDCLDFQLLAAHKILC